MTESVRAYAADAAASEATRVSPARRRADMAVIAVFVALILLPLTGKLLPTQGAFALTENRRPAPIPTVELGAPGWRWSLISYPRRLERFWNDSFAFRWYLIRAHSLANVALGVAPSPKALIGQDGYLFYAAERSVEYFRGVSPFTEADLTRWQDDLEARRVWLAERGIRYLVVVAPNKETIYGEYMPPTLRPYRQETRFDQLLAHLRTHSNLDIVDLRGPLRNEKPSVRVYHKTDTHWNDAGALIAAESILARLKTWFPDLTTAPLPGTLTRHVAMGGDLARIFALEDRYTEERLDWTPDAAIPMQRGSASDDASREVFVTQCDACNGPKMVMNHDSFGDSLAPLLAGHFPRAVFVEGSKLDRGLIEREKPDVVIQEFVERALMCPDLRGC